MNVKTIAPIALFVLVVVLATVLGLCIASAVKSRQRECLQYGEEYTHPVIIGKLIMVRTDRDCLVERAS